MENSKGAAEVFDKLANLYQDKFMDTAMYNETFNQFCDQVIKPGARILELACGPGNITRYLLNRRDDFKILGTDLAPNMLKLARNNNPEAEFKLMDCRDISNLATTYEGIMCGFCLPYLTKPEALQLIKDTKNILTAKGILYISTMENNHNVSGYKTSSSGNTLFINYHEAEYLTDALKHNGYEVINLERIKYPGKDGTMITDLIIIAGL